MLFQNNIKNRQNNGNYFTSWLSVASGLGSLTGLSDNKAQHTCLGLLSITELDPVTELSPSEELKIDQVEELVAKLDTDSLQDRLIGVALLFNFIIWQRPEKYDKVNKDESLRRKECVIVLRHLSVCANAHCVKNPFLDQ